MPRRQAVKSAVVAAQDPLLVRTARGEGVLPFLTQHDAQPLLSVIRILRSRVMQPASTAEAMHHDPCLALHRSTAISYSALKVVLTVQLPFLVRFVTVSIRCGAYTCMADAPSW